MLVDGQEVDRIIGRRPASSSNNCCVPRPRVPARPSLPPHSRPQRRRRQIPPAPRRPTFAFPASSAVRRWWRSPGPRVQPPRSSPLSADQAYRHRSGGGRRSIRGTVRRMTSPAACWRPACGSRSTTPTAARWARARSSTPAPAKRLILTCGHVFRDSQGKGKISSICSVPASARRAGTTDQLRSEDRLGSAEHPAGHGGHRRAVGPGRIPLRPHEPVTNIGCNHGADPRPEQPNHEHQQVSRPAKRAGGRPAGLRP